MFITTNNLARPVWIIVSLLIFIYSIIFTIGTDYSWYMSITDYYLDNHLFYNQTNEMSGGWGVIFISINAFFIQIFGDFYLNYWLFQLLYSLIGTYYLYKLLKFVNINSLSAYTAILVYVIFGFSTGIFIGTRPESIYVSSIIIELYYVFLFYETNKYKFVYISAFASLIGALSHPNGVITFVVLFFVLLRTFYTRKIKIFHILTNFLLLLFMFYFGITFEQDIETLTKIILDISSDTLHTIPFYYEPVRYINFLFNHSLAGLLLIMGFILTLANLIKKISLTTNRDQYYTIASSFIFILIYLTLLGAKWDYYLALLFPFIVLSIGKSINNIHNNLNLSFLTFLILVSISGVIDNFKKNELFLQAFNIKSERVVIIQDLKNSLLKNKIIVAPIQLYSLFRNKEYFIPLEKLSRPYLKNFNLRADYIILNPMVDKSFYEKKFAIKLNYNRGFIYNNCYFNLFKISQSKQ